MKSYNVNAAGTGFLLFYTLGCRGRELLPVTGSVIAMHAPEDLNPLSDESIFTTKCRYRFRIREPKIVSRFWDIIPECIPMTGSDNNGKFIEAWVYKANVFGASSCL